MPTPRRLAHALRACLLLAVLAVAGCGSSSDDERGGGASSTATATTAAAGTFPATVEHKFGTTTVESAPRRIVTVGLTEQDTVLALGSVPIATTEWYGERPNAVWPWARAALGDAKPEVLSNKDGFQFERIAALEPDLIIGTNAGMRQGDYDKLSALAPTITSAKGSTDYFSRWDEQVALIAAALGQPERGQELVREVRARFADAAADNPEFRGKTVSFNQNGFYDGQIYSYPDGLNTEFLTYLGFEIEPRVTALAGKPGEQVGVSAERLDVLDSDVALFATEEPKDVKALEKIPTFMRMESVAGNRAVFTDGTLAGAIYFMTPLSLEYVAERLPPQLARAVAGRAPRAIG